MSVENESKTRDCYQPKRKSRFDVLPSDINPSITITNNVISEKSNNSMICDVVKSNDVINTLSFQNILENISNTSYKSVTEESFKNRLDKALEKNFDYVLK